jgi:hypothetical protein
MEPKLDETVIATRAFQGAKGENSALEIDDHTCTKLLGAESATTLEKEQALSA